MSLFIEFKDEMVSFLQKNNVKSSDILYIRLEYNYWIPFEKFMIMKDAPNMWKYTDWNDILSTFQKENDIWLIHTQFAIVLNNSKYIGYQTDCGGMYYDEGMSCDKEFWYMVDGNIEKPEYEYTRY